MTSWILVLMSVTLASEDAGPALRPERIETLFVEPERPVTIRWQAAGDLPSDPICYKIRDFADREIGTGTAERPDARAVVVQATLPQGYYEIELSGVATRFGVVALPAVSETPDPFFSIDSALSWLVRDAALREGLVRVLRRSGIAMSRERLSWGDVHRTREAFDWNGRHGYETVRQLYAEQKVPVLEMFHSATPWSGTVGKYPDDLIGTSASWREITRRWRTTWSALEVWNEPDIFFGDLLPADQYVALVRTLAYAAACEAPDLTLVGGVMAHYHRPFLDTAAQCGMLACVDVASFHTYDRAARMEELVGKYRDWLAAHGRGDMPLWITESGRPWKKGPSRPPADQDAVSALDITRKAIEVRACGVARYFAFVYPFYEENENNFGMMDRLGTPLRSFAAYAQAARVLGGKRYMGDLRINESLPAARVFGDDRETVAVLTAGSDVQRTALPADLPARRIEGLDGRTISLDAAGEVPVLDGLVYAWLDRDSVAPRLDAKTEAMRLWNLGQAPPRQRSLPSPIVLRWQIDPQVVKPETAGYRLVEPSPGKVRFTVRAFNLGKQPDSIDLSLEFGAAPVRILSANPCSIRLAPAAFADASWDVDMTEAFALQDKVEVLVLPVGKDSRTPRLVVSLIGEPTIANCLRRFPRHVRLPLGEAARWQRNVPSYGRLGLDPQSDGSVRMDVSFKEGDRWVYPFFTLPNDLDLSRFSALVLRARCERPAIVRVMLWEADGGAAYLTSNSVVPSDGKWHVAEIPFADLTLSSANAPDDNGRLDLNQVRRISIGMNSDAAENSLEVSEAYLAGPK